MQIANRKAQVTAVIPCLDEEDAIGDLVREVRAQGVHRVFVVDGGSRDATAARAAAAGATVLVETRRGYGRACAAGVEAAGETDVILFLDGDGSDDPAMIPAVIGPILLDEADFVMGSRLRGTREPGSLGPQQIVAGRIASLLMRAFYGEHLTDMSPFRAVRPAVLASLAMRETTFGWNLEMQIRAAVGRLRIVEVPVGCRARRGGVSKVSGNAAAAIPAAWSIAKTFVRLSTTLKRTKRF